MNTSSIGSSMFARSIALWGIGGVLVWAGPAGAQAIGPDFNGDGFADLAIAAAAEDIGPKSFAGVVHVLYGRAEGLRARENQTWHQDVDGMQSQAATFDFFGSGLAWGDFNGDGFDDLAIGAPGKTVNSHFGAGAVTVIYGSANGLQVQGNQLFHQNVSTLGNTAQADDFFGDALASGDFNGDGFADLAIGVPGENLGPAVDAGAVQIIYGSPAGLTPITNQFVHQNTLGMRNRIGSGDMFGSVLASGDFDNDGHADLAIGVPGERVGGHVNAGAVQILYGTPIGISVERNQIFTQRSGGMHNSAGFNDTFGSSLAVGDFDGDGRDDLAVGVPGETMLGVNNAGAVAVIFGTNNGLRTRDNQIWHTARSGMGLSLQPGAMFGHSLAAGDFNGDGRDDLAIGAPGQWIGINPLAGAVLVLYGTNNGLSTQGRRLLHQNAGGISGSAAPGNQFGFAVAARDFNGDGVADLAIGAPYATVAEVPQAGAVHILYGSSNTGITTGGSQTFHQNHPALDEIANPGDSFGESL